MVVADNFKAFYHPSETDSITYLMDPTDTTVTMLLHLPLAPVRTYSKAKNKTKKEK